MSIRHTFTSSTQADLDVYPHPEFPGEDVVALRIKRVYAWTASDIRELRKYLKKLQRELEQSDLDRLVI